MSPHRRAGFTLLEVIAVVLLTGILITFTTNFYLDLSAQSRAAVEKARLARRAVVLLDRVARDLESAMLVTKPAERDPLEHPWLFLAEADDPDQGAQRLKFSSHGHRPRSPQAAESDVEMVAWMLSHGANGRDFELLRWSSPHLPPGRDLAFPSPEDGDPVADGIARFGVFLIGEDGERVARWDSSALTESSALPLAAEIQVSFFADEESDTVVGPFVRRVSLPLRPLDLEAQLAAAGAGGPGAGVDTDGDGVPDAEEDEDGDGVPDGEDPEVAGGDEDAAGMTAAACFALNPQLGALLAAAGVPDEVVQSMQGLPASVVAAQAGFPLPANCQ